MPILTVMLVNEKLVADVGVIWTMAGLMLVMVHVMDICGLVQVVSTVVFLNPILESN